MDRFYAQVATKEANENNDENGIKEDQIDDDEMNFSLPMKKKKKKKVYSLGNWRQTVTLLANQ